MKPEDVTFQLLREITDDFSEERKLGAGGYGVVYKGVNGDEKEVAVKKLYNANPELNDKQFQREFYNLKMLNHKNIVQIFGYCYETEEIPTEYNGRIVLAEKTYRALCLEYMHNGSLQNHLSNDLHKLDWHTRYKIIKGTCKGLKYIHDELDEPVYHLDLKPDNILLDKDMTPKLADFGLSRIFGAELTRFTNTPVGTIGYQPPEYIERSIISPKFDIFSMGVIMIKIVSGPGGYTRCADMTAEEFVDLVQESWRNILQSTWCGSLLDAYCQQVKICTQIALNCLDKDRHKRPNIKDIIDKLDEIETEISKLPRKGCRSTSSRVTMPIKTTKKIRMETKGTTDGHQNFSRTVGPRCKELECIDTRETSSNVQELIIGRDKEKESLISLLESTTQKITILPIYGIGGIGKTTLAKLIYNDIKFKCYSQVWVYVSQAFDLKKIGNSIISQLSEKESEMNERQMIYNCLEKVLAGKKILIVLDDIWEDDFFKLNDLKSMLMLGKSSNIIVLVTTRGKCIAEKLCTDNPHKIEYLTNEMCWDIIKQKSCFEAREDKEQLRGIGMEIAMKCGGVALAAQCLGYMLQSMNSDEWGRVKDSDIWNEYDSTDASFPNHVFASLKLSYNWLDPNLRSCFTYCAIFPKGHKIIKDDLILQWVSLGFIKPKILSTKQLGEKYFAQLLGLCFLQYSKSPLTQGVYNEHVPVFTMHDLVHDMTMSVLGDAILDQSKQGNTRGSSCSYALLTNCSRPLKLSIMSSANLRALRFHDCSRTKLHGAAFAPAKSLQVLDLSDCSIDKLPDSIGQLTKLRYLNAPGIQDRKVPECITKLSNLMYLNLHGSSDILALPESIGEMEALVHLDLSDCWGIGKLPESLGDLKNLEHVDFKRCSSITGVSQCLARLTKLQYLNLSYCSSIGDLPNTFGRLTQLQYLDLSYSSYLHHHAEVEFLGTFTKLEYLNLSSKSPSIVRMPEALGSLTKLKYLHLSGLGIAELPRSFGNLRGLVHLDMSMCLQVRGVPEALSGLTKLQYLNLSQCSASRVTKQESLIGLEEILGNLSELRYLNLGGCLKSIFGGQPLGERNCFLGRICTLPNLEYLDLSRNENLYSIPDTISVLSKLHTLDLSFCNNLKRLPPSISESASLKILNTLNCYHLDIATLPQNNNGSLLLPCFVVRAGGGESSSTLVQLKYENPTILQIDRLENVKNAEEARKLRLVEKQRIKYLRLRWTKNAKRFVDDNEVLGGLVPPDTIEYFSLWCYNSVSYPSWIMGIATYLPQLVKIILVDFPCCNNLPPLGQLPNLEVLEITSLHNIRKIDGDFYGGTRAFPQLEFLNLAFMNCLEEWNTTCSSYEDGSNDELAFPNLQSLYIQDCPNLRQLPDLRYLSCLGTLSVRSCKSLVSLPEWLGDLISLEDLRICKCEGVKTLPESIQELPLLESLEISRCPELVQWCGSELAHINVILTDSESETDGSE